MAPLTHRLELAVLTKTRIPLADLYSSWHLVSDLHPLQVRCSSHYVEEEYIRLTKSGIEGVASSALDIDIDEPGFYIGLTGKETWSDLSTFSRKLIEAFPQGSVIGIIRLINMEPTDHVLLDIPNRAETNFDWLFAPLDDSLIHLQNAAYPSGPAEPSHIELDPPMTVLARPSAATPAVPRVTPVLRRTDHPGGESLPAPELRVVDAWRVACDGARGVAGAALGHPRVWLSIDAPVGWVDCGYCDARFVHRSALGRATGAGEAVAPASPPDHAGPQPGNTTA